MKAIAILFLLGATFIVLGEFYFSSGRSADERLGGILPTFIGLVLLVIDFIMLVVWLVRRRKAKASPPPC